ncbi:MAG: AtpZ/AtpI family protein [Lachnospiraceae bacterium]|nr:AtpZ/AtpI family protein [Lachnospiraceae bacterium]
MKYQNNVYQSFTMIMQFGFNMIVPICLCSFAGIWLDNKFGTSFWTVVLFFIGALAGFRNIYIMAKKIYSKKGERDHENDKK